MKKTLGWILAVLLVLAIGGTLLYKFYLPQLIAKAVVTEGEPPAYVPKVVERQISRYKVPLSNAATDIVKSMHASDVTMGQVFEAIDKTEPQHIQMAFDELQTANVKTPDDAFNIFKKHVNADFDVEVLREPFTKNVNMKMIRVATKKAHQYNEDAVDADLAKAIIKNILLQKEKELAQNDTSK